MLHNPRAFFEHCRDTLLGPRLSPEEVKGCEAILLAMEGAPVSYVAYALATAFHETGHDFQPRKEFGGYKYLDKYDTGKLAKALGNTSEDDDDGQLYAGRGYVQLTGRRNYAKAGTELGLPLLGNPDLAMKPDVAAKILRRGMEEGWFSGKGFKNFLPPDGPAELIQFIMARKIINGMDRANLIAKHAMEFQTALLEGQWK